MGYMQKHLRLLQYLLLLLLKSFSWDNHLFFPQVGFNTKHIAMLRRSHFIEYTKRKLVYKYCEKRKYILKNIIKKTEIKMALHIYLIFSSSRHKIEVSGSQEQNIS